MKIVVWDDGYWEYLFKSALTHPSGLWLAYRIIDIDRHLDYDLEEHEIQACMEALDG